MATTAGSSANVRRTPSRPPSRPGSRRCANPSGWSTPRGRSRGRNRCWRTYRAARTAWPFPTVGCSRLTSAASPFAGGTARPRERRAKRQEHRVRRSSYAGSCCMSCRAASLGSDVTDCWPTATGGTTWRWRASRCTWHRYYPTRRPTKRWPCRRRPCMRAPLPRNGGAASLLARLLDSCAASSMTALHHSRSTWRRTWRPVDGCARCPITLPGCPATSRCCIEVVRRRPPLFVGVSSMRRRALRAHDARADQSL